MPARGARLDVVVHLVRVARTGSCQLPLARVPLPRPEQEWTLRCIHPNDWLACFPLPVVANGCRSRCSSIAHRGRRSQRGARRMQLAVRRLPPWLRCARRTWTSQGCAVRVGRRVGANTKGERSGAARYVQLGSAPGRAGLIIRRRVRRSSPGEHSRLEADGLGPRRVDHDETLELIRSCGHRAGAR